MLNHIINTGKRLKRSPSFGTDRPAFAQFETHFPVFRDPDNELDCRPSLTLPLQKALNVFNGFRGFDMNLDEARRTSHRFIERLEPVGTQTNIVIAGACRGGTTTP